MKNCYFDFWDMKEYDVLPNATLYGNTAKSVESFPFMRAIFNGEIYTNVNGEWIKDGAQNEQTITIQAPFTNLKDQAVFQYGKRYSMTSGAFVNAENCTAMIIPVPTGVTSMTLRMKGTTKVVDYPLIYGGTSVESFTDKLGSMPLDNNGTYKVELTKDSNISYITFFITCQVFFSFFSYNTGNLFECLL